MKWKWNLPIYYFCFLIVFDLLSSNYIRELDSYTLMYNIYSYIRTFYHLMPLILIIVITIIELLKKKRSFKNLINLVRNYQGEDIPVRSVITTYANSITGNVFSEPRAF